ncbi:phenylalanine ammonia-lyase [Rhizoctonia solani]|uniref:Phenylalanine ammonia-lyase n=1 Tax=Rhizoctonia solani TaxID=456999 RepID=A0A8H8P6J3_9AGAM|nr:phenylalanine ammonia-lyase [Rhizoctonia solani]QRW25470.1 phenylalanine ammonia-lyase [Rhizoctonia solani]
MIMAVDAVPSSTTNGYTNGFHKPTLPPQPTRLPLQAQRCLRLLSPAKILYSPTSKPVIVNGHNLTIPSVVAAARHGARVALDDSHDIKSRMTKAENAIEDKLRTGKVFMVFPPDLVVAHIADTRTSQHLALGKALLQHQHSGILPSFTHPGHVAEDKPEAPLPLSDPLNTLSMPESWVRAAMLIRMNSLIRGHSGVRWELLERMVSILDNDITPLVPLRGSISASGDLSPLSYVAGTIFGNEQIRCYHGKRNGELPRQITSSRAALQAAGIEPLKLAAKEHLGLLNGTAFSAAVASLALNDAVHMGMLAQVLTAMGTEALVGTQGSHHPFIHAVARPHPGQVEAAKHIWDLLEGSKLAQLGEEKEITIEEDEGKLRQDRYPLRTAPQFIGPQLEDILHAWSVVTQECNTTTDNPLIDGETGHVHHGGNFQAMAVTNAMEKTRLALHHLGKILFAQSTELLNPAFNRGLPPSLAASDPSVNYHAKGLDIASAAYVSELGFLANPVSTHVQSAEMHNQAVNSLALISARATVQALDVLSLLTASYLYLVCQAVDLRAQQRELATGVAQIINEELGKNFAAVSIASVQGPVFKAVMESYEVTSTMDAAPRMHTAAAAATAPLIELLPESDLAGIKAFRSAVGNRSGELYARLQGEYLRGERGAAPAAHLLGNTRPVYEFVRVELGVKMHGIDNLNRFEEGWTGLTVGQNVSVIYEAIRDGKLQEVIASLLSGVGYKLSVRRAVDQVVIQLERKEQERKTPKEPESAIDVPQRASSEQEEGGENTDNTEQDQVDSAESQGPVFKHVPAATVARAGSKSALDLRTPTRDTFSIVSGSSGDSGGGRSMWGEHSVSQRGYAAWFPIAIVVQAQISTAPPVCVCDTCLFPDSGSPSQPLQKVAPVATLTPDYVLGVVGTKGCGKSTFIRLAFQAVDPEESRIVAASADGPTITLACTTVSRGTARIFEIDADELLDVSEPVSDNWLLWPEGFPRLHGLAVCYDACDQRSYDQAKQIIAGVEKSFGSSFITLFVACKSDSLHASASSAQELPPTHASKLANRHGFRFVQITNRGPDGLSQMVHTFQWMLDRIGTSRGTKRLVIIPRGKKSSGRTSEPTLRTGSRTPEPLKTPEPPVEPTLPARARTKSAGDLVSAWISDGSDARAEKAPVRHIIEKAGEEKGSRRSIGEESVLAYGFPKVPTGVPAVVREEREREGRSRLCRFRHLNRARKKPPAPLCMRWATVEQLIDKLFFCGVSEDAFDDDPDKPLRAEPWFSFNFFLTYRLFTTPRTVLLSFQKRLKELEQSPVDPLLAGFVQQRLCALLQNWIEDYPNDFASPGAPSALAAVVRTACENTHLMYYGSEFTYFLEELPCLKDDAFSWAYISAETPVEDEYEFDLDFDREFNFSPEADGFPLFDPSYSIAPGSAVGNADHDEEPPMTGRTARFESGNGESIGRGLSPDARRGASPALKAFQSVAKALLEYNCQSIAEEITRLETELFLKIKPRDWVRRGVKEDKLGKPKSIVEMNAFFDRICKWVMSIVVSLDRAQERVRLVTHLCEVAQSLRAMNNYSSLRAFHVGINCVCETGDVVQSQVDVNVWRKYQSREKLLRVNENHLLYRMAVKNTFGVGIPSLEVHSSDLSRIGECPILIPKVSFTGPSLLISEQHHEIHAFQERIRENGDYAFGPVPGLAKLILETELLDMETIYERCSQVDRDLQHGYPVPMATSTASRLREYLRR